MSALEFTTPQHPILLPLFHPLFQQPQVSPLIPYHNFMSNDKFSDPHKLFLVIVTPTSEPFSFSEAVADPKWCDDMKLEVDASKKNKTWDIVSSSQKTGTWQRVGITYQV